MHLANPLSSWILTWNKILIFDNLLRIVGVFESLVPSWVYQILPPGGPVFQQKVRIKYNPFDDIFWMFQAVEVKVQVYHKWLLVFEQSINTRLVYADFISVLFKRFTGIFTINLPDYFWHGCLTKLFPLRNEYKWFKKSLGDYDNIEPINDIFQLFSSQSKIFHLMIESDFKSWYLVQSHDSSDIWHRDSYEPVLGNFECDTNV